MIDLNGKVALITGAASGIGRETALTMVRLGARIGVADVDAAGGEATVADIAALSGEALFIPLDVTDEDAWPAALSALTERFGGIDVAVNAAGVELMKTMADTSLAEFRQLMAVNLDGVFLGTKYAMLAMAKGNGGSIVNISSVAGINGFPRQSAYCASKGGVRLLTKAAAMEAAELGYKVRVNSVHPGVIDTPMARAFIAELPPDQAQARWDRLAQLHPIGRMGEASDVANAIAFLASDASSFMTGTEIIVDGGMTAR